MRPIYTALPIALTALTATALAGTAHADTSPAPILSFAGASCGDDGHTIHAWLHTNVSVGDPPHTITVRTGSSWLLPPENITVSRLLMSGTRLISVKTNPARSGAASLIITAKDEAGRTSTFGTTVRMGTSTGIETITGTAGRDWIVTRGGTNHVNAGAGDDIVCGGPFGEFSNIQVDAGAGNDHVWGGDAADLIIGGLGNDTLKGRSGEDTFTGGPGADSFDGGHDYTHDDSITDFNPAEGDTRTNFHTPRGR